MELLEDKKYADWRTACRLCMARSADMEHLFADDAKTRWCEQIAFCTGLEIQNDPLLPLRICTSCVNDLDVAFKFKTTCLNAHETFEKLLALEVKTEIPIDYHDELLDNFDDADPEMDIKDESDVSKKGAKKRGRPRKPQPGRARASNPRPSGAWRHCRACDRHFSTKPEADEHKRLTHADQPPPPFVCEVCGKVFTSRASVYSHMKGHRAPAFACAHCDYRTCHKYDLVKHLLVHNGTKAHRCALCAASYYTSSNLRQHVQRSHDRLTRYQCAVCAHRFYERSKLARHMDSHNEIKRYACEHCPSAFTRRSYWRQHALRRHGVVVPAPRPGRQRAA